MARLRCKYRKDEKGRKGLQYYYAEFYDAHRHPKQKRISLGTRDETAARQKLAKLEREHMAGLYDPWDDAPKREGVSLKDAVERYLRAHRDRRPKTQRADRGVLMLFSETLPPGIKLQHVQEHHTRKFLETDELSDATKNTEDFKTKSGHERVVFVYGDAREVLERLHAGRSTEADAYVFQGTSNREGTRWRLNPEYVSKRFLRYARLAKLSKGIHFHSLRHTYAFWLVMAGVDLFRVKELLGHADISTTTRYAHLAPTAFQDELQRVFG